MEWSLAVSHARERQAVRPTLLLAVGACRPTYPHMGRARSACATCWRLMPCRHLNLLAILTAALYVLSSLSPQAFQQVVAQISGALPSGMTGAINLNALKTNLVHITGPLALISLAGLLWGGANLFSSMDNVFSIFFRTKARSFLAQKLMAIGMVVILAILLPLSLAASSVVTAGSSAFGSVLPPSLTIVLSIVGPLTSLFVLWVLFLVIYMVVPNTKVPFRIAWRGAAAAAVLFAPFDLLFPLD